MSKIFIGIPSNRNDEKFRDSLFSFCEEIEKEHTVDCAIVKNKFLSDAQNELTDIFLGGDFEYMLFLDDDHWGHTKEMLECLLCANNFVATIKTYSRHYPYSCALMKKIQYPNGAQRYSGIEDGQGYQFCDLTGFPMTLIKRELFDWIGYPYFRARAHGQRDWATDQDFFERLAQQKIRPIGCFQYTLAHGDVTEENVLELRSKGAKESNQEVMLSLLHSRMIASNLSDKERI